MLDALQWAFRCAEIPSGPRFTLVALAKFADAEGHCHPGQQRLVEMTGQSERTVRNHLGWLEQRGYIHRRRRYREDGSRSSDGYVLQVNHLPATVAGRSAAKTAGSAEPAKGARTPSETIPAPTGNDYQRQKLPVGLPAIDDILTGNGRQGYRQLTTSLPAMVAGHELSSELPDRTTSELSPPTPPEGGVRMNVKKSDVHTGVQSQKTKKPKNRKTKPETPSPFSRGKITTELSTTENQDRATVESSAAPTDPPRQRPPRFDAGAVPLPPGVDAALWQEWVQHRRELRKPLTPTSVRQQLALLAAHPGHSSEIIRTSIRSGWQGLFAPKGGNGLAAPLADPQGCARQLPPIGSLVMHPNVRGPTPVRCHHTNGEITIEPGWRVWPREVVPCPQ